MNKRLYMFPTEAESQPFRKALPAAEVRISGVGAAETAASVAKALRDGYSDIVLAGIAGTYDETVEAGAVFAVSEERMIAAPSTFTRAYKAPKLPKGIPAAVSNTVSVCGAAAGGAVLENMEGAVFFAMCGEAGVRYCEFRAVSNRVGAPRGEWHTELAAENLARTLMKMDSKEKFMNKTKIILWSAAVIIVVALIALLATQWRAWLTQILTWVIVIAVSFFAGWLTGRFGGRRSSKAAKE